MPCVSNCSKFRWKWRQLILVPGIFILGNLQAQEKPAFTAEADQEAPYNDHDLSVQVLDDDLLSNASFTSSLPLRKGDPSQLTDGVGSKFVQGSCTFGEDGTDDWIVTFSSLKISELHEIRVFSSNGDSRACQDYDVSFSSDKGETFSPLATNVIAEKRKAYNLTRIPLDVGKVTDLRFTFRNPGERKNPRAKLHSALYEIDAIGVPWVPPSLTEARKMGRKHSRFLSDKMAISANADVPEPDLVAFKNEIQPLLDAACVQCHGPDKQKGKFRVDTLNPDFLKGGDVDWWLEVLNVVTNHEMPPEADVELADADRGKLVDWLSAEVQMASRVLRAEGEHSSFRRMTRYEYTYTLQDLLGLPYEFGADLPPETASEDGFRNSSEMLSISASQFETYRDLARTALEKATVRGDKPEPQWIAADFDRSVEAIQAEVERRVELAIKKGGNKNLKAIRSQAEARPFAPWFRSRDTGKMMAARTISGRKLTGTPSESPEQSTSQLILNAPQNADRRRLVPFDLGRLLPDEGPLRVRVRASRNSTDDPHIPVLQVSFGFGNGNNGVVDTPYGNRNIEASPEDPGVYEWDLALSEIQRNQLRNQDVPGRSPTERISLANVYPSPQGSRANDLPAIRINSVEVGWPVYDQWPPESHRRVFPESDLEQDESAYAREILTHFLTQAWRQPVEGEDLERMLGLFATIRPTCEDFQEAVIEVLAVGLASPRFLYLVQESDTEKSLTGHELATRLSYFLWCSSPDQELLRLADNQQILQPDVLTAQTRRMLADPRSRRFAEQFSHQWLNLELLDFLAVDATKHPSFDRDLKTAMHGEIVAFFEEVLANNESILDFIESDFTMLNQRLAQHYEISDVYGSKFQRVALKPEQGRGGLLTQGGVLAMTSNGIDSNPLRRGIWLLENLLNDPPPPPPPAVPEIDVADPEIAKLTLKERLEDHRDDPACMSCHKRIDPWGIAFENYDAVGKWRSFANDRPVDSQAVLFNNDPLDGMTGLKEYLLKNRQDQFAEALVHKMTTFALGRPLSFGDRAYITQITGDLRSKDDGLATLIHLIVQSEIFRAK